MDAALMLLALLAAGVNFGWQPSDDAADGYEYVVQIEPELLDVLRNGQKVPIESNVPPEIAPIRKVRVVVGRGDLPRTAREPMNHTSYFAGQSGSMPDRYAQSPPAGSRSDNRYAQPPPTNRSDVQPPPALSDRARSALSETGNALRDGLEAGIQAANEQLQGLSGAPSTPAAANPRGRGGVAPPPWAQIARLTELDWSTVENRATSPSSDPTASPGMVPMQTASGWTSIGSDVAAPPILVPRLTAAPADATPVASPDNSLSFPPAAPERELNRSLHSQSSRGLQPPAAPFDDWILGRSDEREQGPTPSPPTLGQSETVTPLASAAPENNLLPLQPPQPATQESQQQQQPATNPWAQRWEDEERWSRPPQSLPMAAAAETPHAEDQAARGNFTEATAAADPRYTSAPAAMLPVQTRPHTETPAAQSPLATTAENAPPAAAPAPGSTAATAPPAQNATPTEPAADQPPWLPLLVVSLLLLASVGANLFLGWSYLDARQKYRNLVRKTADKFRRPATSPA